jgi:cell division protein ZapA
VADVKLIIASREYVVTCQDGEESRLIELGAMVNEMAIEAGGSAGGLNESRQLLFASLLLADKIHDGNGAKSDMNGGKANTDDTKFIGQNADTLEKLATRLEQIADKLEN